MIHEYKNELDRIKTELELAEEERAQQISTAHNERERMAYIATNGQYIPQYKTYRDFCGELLKK